MKKKRKPSPAAADGADYMPGIAIDTVIFGFHERQLKILLLEYRNTGVFALPGGFVRKNEDLNNEAVRVLKERTGLADIWLQQFYTFGDVSRFDPVPMRTILKQNGITADRNHWLLKRFISVGFYALVDFTKAVPTADAMSDVCDWYHLKELPRLMQDHQQIVEKALGALRQNLDRQLIGFNLLPEYFTIGDLQTLYETVLSESLNRSSFQRRILGLEILERIEKKFTGAANKAPFVYRFKDRRAGS
jgi:8-oxo-dGTP diphosphatase